MRTAVTAVGGKLGAFPLLAPPHPCTRQGSEAGIVGMLASGGKERGLHLLAGLWLNVYLRFNRRMPIKTWRIVLPEPTTSLHLGCGWSSSCVAASPEKRTFWSLTSDNCKHQLCDVTSSLERCSRWHVRSRQRAPSPSDLRLFLRASCAARCDVLRPTPGDPGRRPASACRPCPR